MSDPTSLTIDDMVAALARSEADIEAGRIVPGETVVAELRASIARMEAKQTSAPHWESAAPR
jgi:predicted transcriptional regulator